MTVVMSVHVTVTVVMATGRVTLLVHVALVGIGCAVVGAGGDYFDLDAGHRGGLGDDHHSDVAADVEHHGALPGGRIL